MYSTRNQPLRQRQGSNIKNREVNVQDDEDERRMGGGRQVHWMATRRGFDLANNLGTSIPFAEWSRLTAAIFFELLLGEHFSSCSSESSPSSTSASVSGSRVGFSTGEKIASSSESEESDESSLSSQRERLRAYQ